MPSHFGHLQRIFSDAQGALTPRPAPPQAYIPRAGESAFVQLFQSDPMLMMRLRQMNPQLYAQILQAAGRNVGQGTLSTPQLSPILGAQKFDPEGAGYDFENALKAGLKPDETEHWPSRDPTTGLLLKGRKHPTWGLTEKGEQTAGYEIYRAADGRYYSRARK